MAVTVNVNSVAKSKPKYLLLIRKDTNNPVNQSNLKANARSRREARENVCERVTIGFGFTYWMTNWHEFFKVYGRRVSSALPINNAVDIFFNMSDREVFE